MPYRDLRAFISRLEEMGELHRLRVEFDWDPELFHVAKINEQRQGPVLLFEEMERILYVSTFLSAKHKKEV